MHPYPRRILGQLLADHGPSLLDEPARVDAFLADLCGPYHRERFLLAHALRERSSIANGPVAQWLGSCSQRLQKRYCFSIKAATWAVRSWSFALGFSSGDESTSHNRNKNLDVGNSTLSDIPVRTLNHLLADRGPEILNDPVRIDALLADLCGSFARERFLLFHALWERIPAQLVFAHALREHLPTEMVLVHAPRERALAAHAIHPHGNAIHAFWLSQHLQNRYGFSAGATQWAVEGCTFALNIAPPAQNLTTTGKPLPFVEEIISRIRRRDPRSKAWVSAEVKALQKAKEQDEALAKARQKAKERESAEEAVRQKAKEQDEAVAVAGYKAKEREAAEEAVSQKAIEQIEAVAVAGQKAKERESAEEAVRQKALGQIEAVAVAGHKAKEREAAVEAVSQKADERSAEKAVSLSRAKETIAAQEAASTKAKEWIATEATDHQTAREWGAAEEAALQKAGEWVETKAAEHQKIAGWSEAKVAELRMTEELAAAEAVVLRKTEDLVETKTTEQQKSVEWVAAEAMVLQKIKEWVAAKEAARQKMFEWAAAEKAARVKAEERAAAEETARVKAKEQSVAEEAAHVKAREQSSAELDARQMALEEITLQILKETPLTSREVATFLDREHEQAISWLRRLQASGKVESIWLERSPDNPCYQNMEHLRSLAIARESL